MTLDSSNLIVGDRVITSLIKRLKKVEPDETKSYMVLSTPRVGSNLLCRSLENTKLLGFPSEWFNPIFVREICKRLGKKKFNFKQYVKTIKKGSKTQNGVFGLKVHVEHYVYWAKKGINLIDIGFDAFYYIERKR